MAAVIWQWHKAARAAVSFCVLKPHKPHWQKGVDAVRSLCSLPHNPLQDIPADFLLDWKGVSPLSSSSGNCLRLSRKATLSSVPFEFIVLTNGCHTDRGRHSQHSQTYSRVWMRIHLPIHHEYFLSISFILFFSQVSHFLRVPQTLRQLIINAASWQH